MNLELASVAIWDHMLEGWPDEVCGLVWDNGTITRLRNQAASPNRFTVGRTQLAEALAAVSPNEKLLSAVYHSHPNGSTTLSIEDRTSMTAMWQYLPVPWLLATRRISDAVAYDYLATWELNDGFRKPHGDWVRATELANAV